MIHKYSDFVGWHHGACHLYQQSGIWLLPSCMSPHRWAITTVLSVHLYTVTTSRITIWLKAKAACLSNEHIFGSVKFMLSLWVANTSGYCIKVCFQVCITFRLHCRVFAFIFMPCQLKCLVFKFCDIHCCKFCHQDEVLSSGLIWMRFLLKMQTWFVIVLKPSVRMCRK